MNPIFFVQRTFLIAALSCAGLPLYAQDSRQVREPVIPPVCAVLRAQQAGPAPTRPEDDSARLQKAIHDCPAGRALRLTLGTREGTAQDAFLSGPLLLKSGVTLLIDAGVTLYASTNRLAYDQGRRRCGENDATGHGCNPFISANDTEGAGIMGEGVIDGQGGHLIDGRSESWWQIARRAQKENSKQNVPRLIEVNRSREFTLYRITLRNSANFHVTLNRVDGFTAWGVRIDTPHDARNTDGIDPASSRNVTIAHSYIRTGDDNVAIKGGRMGPTENVSILHNHFYSGHGMSIGSETDGGVRRVLVDDLTMEGTTSGLRIKSDVSRGGLVSEVRYRHVCLKDVRAPLDLDTHYARDAVGGKIPVYQGIVFEHVRGLTPGRIILRGYDAAHPLQATLDDVVIDGQSTLQLEHAQLALGPGPVQPQFAGENVQVSGSPAGGAGENCEGRFAAFPVTASMETLRANRPQLMPAQASAYAYAEVLKGTGGDAWDPLSDPLVTAPLSAWKPDYVVDAGGDGARVFKTVQAAVSRVLTDSRGATRKERVYIQVKPGVYRELLYVPASAPPITLYGGGATAADTRISANLDANVTGKRYAENFGAQFQSVDPAIAAMHASLKDRETVSTPGSAVAWIRSNGFQARNLTFENTYNKSHGDDTTDNGAPAIHSQAVAMLVDEADRVQFENVRFSGFQDTLFLKSSSPAQTARSFFNRSYIEGDLDFIFGEATAYFYQTEIKSLGDRRISYATAPDTHYESKYGFVFDSCRFTHDGTANALAGRFYLVRQWFHGQRCTPYGTVNVPGYRCTLAASDAYREPIGTISKDALTAVGKVIILNSEIGAHIAPDHPWSDWNAAGTIKHRPVQYSSEDFWSNLSATGIDPRRLGYAGKKSPAEPFLAEFNNRDE